MWAGNLGNAFISLAFASALIGAISYLVAHYNPLEQKYKRISRIFYVLHAFSIFGAIGTMFFMMINHYFEYAYVWKHTDMQLEKRYLFAAFWEDQEGSFLLWAFWHAVIGLFLLFRSKQWEAPVMMTLCLVQVFLTTMVMGIYIGDVNIGTNPFILMRNHPQFHNIPLFANVIEQNGQKVVDYLPKLIPTARGMNPLLKNYWMTIHPPTLFLGFALTVVPFCFSVAGLMTRLHKEWQRTALPWAFAGVMVLGTGILMGGAWAYEALSFGGFWAWDPVENASFVPWLTLVGAAHLMMVNKARGTSYFGTYLFSVCSFILVLYSTFLTRSGILGESSVHAFTDLGMERLLIYFVVVFIILPVTLMLEKTQLRVGYFLFSVFGIATAEILSAYGIGIRTPVYLTWCFATVALIFYQYFKTWVDESGTEESTWSREFWMFIGSLILFILALTIAGITSFPVFNRLFDTKLAVKHNGITVFNTLGMIFGIFILILIGVTQYLKYRHTDMKKLARNFVISTILASLLTLVIILNYFDRAMWEIATPSQKSAFFIAPIFAFVSCFAFFANIEYVIRILSGKIKNSGSAIAHAGFALIMLGCVISNSGKRVISRNTSTRDVSVLGEKFSNNSNIFLAVGDTLKMDEYYVTYKGRKKKDIHILFEVEYFKLKNNKLEHAFTLYPKVQLNKLMGNAPEPGTKHFLSKDIYTDITHAELLEKEELDLQGGWTATENNVLHVGDTLFTNEYIITLDALETSLNEEEYKKQDSLIRVKAVMSVRDMNNKVTRAYPEYVLRNGMVEADDYVDEQLGLKFVFWKINPETGSVEITLSQKVSKKLDYVVMEAFVFPWINILWTGCVVMILGTALAIVQRVRRNRKKDTVKAHRVES